MFNQYFTNKKKLPVFSFLGMTLSPSIQFQNDLFQLQMAIHLIVTSIYNFTIDCQS